MPRVKESDRIRAKRPKTRTGCRTCKIRKVKCDEAKPACRRCTSTGRPCDGYDFVPNEMALVSSKPAAAIRLFESTREAHSFRYFTERGALELAGVTKSYFWNRVLLQAAHQDTAIRHAILALSALHETFEREGTAAVTTDPFAMTQYNLAIREHLHQVSTLGERADVHQLDRCLASSILFTCIEMIQGHVDSALQLARGSLRLLYDTHPDRDSPSHWPLASLEAFLAILQTQALTMFGQPLNSPAPIPLRFMDFIAVIPDAFTSVTEARNAFNYLTWHLTLSTGPTPPAADDPVRRHHDEQLAKWSRAFRAFLAAAHSPTHHPPLTERERRAIAALHIRALAARHVMDAASDATFSSASSSTPDPRGPAFARIVDLAETLVGHERADPSASADPTTPRYRFTLDSGVLGPMYEVARACRDPGTRRRAIAVLEAAGAREGLLDARRAARVARRACVLEETAVAGGEGNAEARVVALRPRTPDPAARRWTEPCAEVEDCCL